MARARISTTARDLLNRARQAFGQQDSELIDDDLAALLARHRAAEIDASYAAYAEHPLDEPDEWGDLASFVQAVSRS
ncbi:MAG: antitoxin MazE5 [Micrococcus sp.]|nr:antitoxin MazE5 [Micrococcus sp.]